MLENEVQIAPEDMTLENLRTGKITVAQIPRKERLKFELEERDSLPIQEKEEWEAGMGQAWDQGWKPKHLFLGKKQDGTKIEHRGWKEFLDIGKKVMPIENERLKHQNEFQASEIAKLKADIAQMSELQRLQAERSLKKEKIAVENELQQHRIDGNVDGFSEAQNRRADIAAEEELLKKFEPKPFSLPQYDKVQAQADLISFKVRNPWFESDTRMKRQAIGIDAELTALHPNLAPSERYRLVEDEIKKEFPEKFSTTPTYIAAAVESGRASGNAINPKAGQLTFEQLPRDEQERADQMIRLRIGGYKTRADFMTKYNNNKK